MHVEQYYYEYSWQLANNSVGKTILLNFNLPQDMVEGFGKLDYIYYMASSKVSSIRSGGIEGWMENAQLPYLW